MVICVSDSGGPRGRQWCNKKWQELTITLNSEGSGDSKTEEKWRSVWSDFKNNTKKKWAKINKTTKSAGGGPALKTCLTDIEERVMALIGEMAGSGLPVSEVEIGHPMTLNGFYLELPRRYYNHHSLQNHSYKLISEPPQSAESLMQIDLGTNTVCRITYAN
ncbi:hypothetical protein evm_012253 [Chilo suppressalis]|nr:hypothetical protein evm_012253 [Chilo suppressalis]